MFLHHLAADGGVGFADAGKEQSHIVVDFGRSADGAARIAGIHLLLDSDCRRQSLDEIDLGLRHLAKKLAGVSREAFYISALALGVERVEG